MKSNQKFIAANIAALLGLFVATPSFAQLCANKSGQVYSRAQCKAKETVVPSTPGPIGPAGPQGVQGPAGPQGPSAEIKLPCELSSIAGFWELDGLDPIHSGQMCQVMIREDGTMNSGSACIKLQLGSVTSQNLPIVSASITLNEPKWACRYLVNMNLANGENWKFFGSLSSTRNTLNGIFTSSLNHGSTGVGTKAYPSAAATAAAEQNVESALQSMTQTIIEQNLTPDR